MARTKDVILTPEQKEQMEKEFFEALKPMESVNATRNHSQYDDVENADLHHLNLYEEDFEAWRKL